MHNTENNKEKNKEVSLEIGLLFFYLLLSLFSFILYILKHPVINIFTRVSRSDLVLFKIYLPDLIIFLTLLVPYLIVNCFLIVIRMFFNKKIHNGFYIMLFFPLLSFFIKGMSLLNVYSNNNIKSILQDNIAFFLFPIIGIVTVLFIEIIKKIKKT